MKLVNIKISYSIHIILNMYHIILSILSKNKDLRLLRWIPKDNIETNFFNTIDTEDFLINIENIFN